jgi:predicted DNA-binding transcriptional regulator AlpA
MLRSATMSDDDPMPLDIDGVRYLTVPEVLQEMQITRQTLWRWRQEGHIPLGRRFRSRLLVFSPDEALVIRRYANRVEPIVPSDAASQLSLFTSDSKRADSS